jgi:replicative DNA helicase
LGNNLFNNEIEESILSAVLQDGSTFKIIKDYLNPSDFWWKPYAWIYEAFRELDSRSINIDVITVQDELQRQNRFEDFSTAITNIKSQDGFNYIVKKEGVVVNNAESYALTLLEDSSKRKIQEISAKVPNWINQGATSNAMLVNLETELSKISVYSGVKSNLIKRTSEILHNVIKESELAKTRKSYIQTGIQELDKLIGGFFGGQLIFVGGRPGEGKSSALLTFLMHVVLDDTKRTVGLFTLEMDNEEYMGRMIAWVSGVSSLRIKMGKVRDNENQDFQNATKLIEDKVDVLWDDSPSLTIPQLRTKIRRMKEDGASIIFIDQLNLLRSSATYDQESVRINNLARDLKRLAREFDLPLVVAHQMNRTIESAGRTKDKEPKTSDLSQGGDADCDLLIMITHKKEDGVIQSSRFYIPKNRGGPGGYVNVKFIAESTKFVDADPAEQPFGE